MWNNFKKTISFITILAIIVPSFYLAVVQPKRVEAQSIIPGLSDIVKAGVEVSFACSLKEIKDLIKDAIGNLMGILGDYFDLNLSGILEDFDPGRPRPPIDTVDSVPVKETNRQMLDNIERIRSATETVEFKECVLDPMIWVIKKLVIAMITEDILDWIRTGHDDGPVFITDLARYFTDINDESARAFLYDSDENGDALQDWLCEPFAESVIQTVDKISSQPTFGENGDSSCTMDNEFDNGSEAYRQMVEDGNINFENGGITSAMELIQDGNNPYSAFFNVQSEAAYRVNRFAAEQAAYISWGNGYLPDKKFPNDLENVKRIVVTPGTFISTQINNWAEGSLSELEVADEVAEVLDAILSSLIDDIFNMDGLLNSSQDNPRSNERDNVPNADPIRFTPSDSNIDPDEHGICHPNTVVIDPVRGETCDQSLDECCQNLCQRCADAIEMLGTSWEGRLNNCVRTNNCRAGVEAN